jgi:hypothetical protein
MTFNQSYFYLKCLFFCFVLSNCESKKKVTGLAFSKGNYLQNPCFDIFSNKNQVDSVFLISSFENNESKLFKAENLNFHNSVTRASFKITYSIKNNNKIVIYTKDKKIILSLNNKKINRLITTCSGHISEGNIYINLDKISSSDL